MKVLASVRAIAITIALAGVPDHKMFALIAAPMVPGGQCGLISSGSQHGCVRYPFADSTGSIGVLQTEHGAS